MDNKGVSSSLTNMVNRFCEQHNITSPIHKIYDVDERIPLTEWHRILTYLNERYQKPDLGIALGKISRASDIGIVAYLCMSCTTVAEVFDLIQRYQRIWYHISNVEVQENNTCIRYTWQSPAYILAGDLHNEARLVNDTAFAMIVNFVNHLVEPAHFYPLNMAFSTTAPSSTQQHEQFFHCPVHFNAPVNYIEYDKAMLQLKIKQPCQRDTQILHRILEKNANQLLSKYPEDADFNEIINRAIIKAIQQHRSDIHFVAESLGMSSRLLQHRLKQHHSHFSQHLTQIRKSLALQYLEDASLHISDIASLLAYHEPASFNRAFKSWTGLSPLQWRQENLNQIDYVI
ncbi:AraC family transcriptional regulator [Acinetobacter larvae]|nr:AraC family transcriptional regulator [Acinetobacter larvae]